LATPVFFIHTIDFNKKGDDIGPGTIARAKGALYKAVQRNETKRYFLVTAGTPAPTTGEPMCLLVKRWLIKQNIPSDWILTPQIPRADNTAAEIVDAMQIVEQKFLHGEPFFDCSSLWHIPRIAFMWPMYGRRVRPRFVWVLDRKLFSPRWLIREMLGIGALMLRLTGPRWIPQELEPETEGRN